MWGWSRQKATRRQEKAAELAREICSLYQRSTEKMAAAIILAMRIRLLTGVFVLSLCGFMLGQTNSQPLHADRVIVLKKERTLELLN
jgi:hypothetical protein